MHNCLFGFFHEIFIKFNLLIKLNYTHYYTTIKILYDYIYKILGNRDTKKFYENCVIPIYIFHFCVQFSFKK